MTLIVLVGLAVPNKAVFDPLVGLVVPLEAALGWPLNIRAHYGGLGGAQPAPCRNARRPGWSLRVGHGLVEMMLGWLPDTAHTILFEALYSLALDQLPNTALSVPVECPACLDGRGGALPAARYGA